MRRRGAHDVGGFLVVNAIEEAIYNCNPDPYFPEWCQAPGIVNLSILNGPWLVAPYLLARREAIVLFACLFMGWMWWLGVVVYLVLSIPGPLDIGVLGVAVGGGATAMLVIGLLTAVVGSAMQVFIRRRRRKRLPHPA